MRDVVLVVGPLCRVFSPCRRRVSSRMEIMSSKRPGHVLSALPFSARRDAVPPSLMNPPTGRLFCCSRPPSSSCARSYAESRSGFPWFDMFGSPHARGCILLEIFFGL